MSDSRDDTPVGGTLFTVARRRLLRAPRWWRRGGWSRVMGVLGVLALVGVAYLAVTVVQVWDTGRNRTVQPADAIVVMGAAQYDGRPSPQLQARLDHALGLWQFGVAPTIIVTGGNRPGDRFTEAESSANYLTERGVPASAILSENTGSTSWQSLRNVAALAAERGLARLVLVSDPFHSLRIKLMVEELGLSAQTSSTATSPVRGWLAFRRHVEEAAGVALGRIIGFDTVETLVG
ncbi:MAG: YdcF family protein [Actinomycetota bacterium]